MLFSELLEATKDIDLEAIHVSLGKKSNSIGTLSCYQDGNDWVMVEIDDRQREYEKRGEEKDIVRKMFGNIKIRRG